MDQEEATSLFLDGAIFLFLDVPQGTEFGIDYNSWTVGEKFKGVKMIPPGIHFVYFSACNSDGQPSPRTGFFYNFRPQEIFVRKWNKLNEDICEEEISDEELHRYQDNKLELDQYLGPYPYENYKKWVSLSNYVTDDLVNRLQPLNVRIVSVSEFISEPSNSLSRQQARLNKEGNNVNFDSEPTSFEEAQARLPDMKLRAGSMLRFSEISKIRYPPGSSSQVITKYSMDSSYALERFLAENHPSNINDILGEIQFSFICFLIGQVYDAFDQWKNLVHLICGSEEALQKHVAMFTSFISMLHFQVKEIPEDFFVDIVSQNNFLTSTLQEFFANLDNEAVDEGLRKKGLKFRDHLTQKFKWDFTSEPDDYAPVIVSVDS